MEEGIGLSKPLMSIFNGSNVPGPLHPLKMEAVLDFNKVRNRSTFMTSGHSLAELYFSALGSSGDRKSHFPYSQ
jgi:hypothetical protein